MAGAGGLSMCELEFCCGYSAGVCGVRSGLGHMLLLLVVAATYYCHVYALHNMAQTLMMGDFGKMAAARCIPSRAWNNMHG